MSDLIRSAFAITVLAICVPKTEATTVERFGFDSLCDRAETIAHVQCVSRTSFKDDGRGEIVTRHRFRVIVPVKGNPGDEIVLTLPGGTADGRRLLVIHGDEFDCIVRYARWLALLGDIGYRAALSINNRFNSIRRRLGYPYWSLSAFLKHKVKNAVEHISNFEGAIAEEAGRRNVDGVVCGHIHHAEIRDIGGVLYCNDGDWVESCTALVEHFDGRLEILHWATVETGDALALAS